VRADEGHRLPSDATPLCGGLESGRLQALNQLGQSGAVPERLTGPGSQADNEEGTLFEDSRELAEPFLLRRLRHSALSGPPGVGRGDEPPSARRGR
jgi:hypothetical protein